jgi:hypothetical protein
VRPKGGSHGSTRGARRCFPPTVAPLREAREANAGRSQASASLCARGDHGRVSAWQESPTRPCARYAEDSGQPLESA